MNSSPMWKVTRVNGNLIQLKKVEMAIYGRREVPDDSDRAYTEGAILKFRMVSEFVATH
jgi:hypothetical protein